MSQQELLNTLIDCLNQYSIPYMLTGSVVSSLQGEPRLSHDIDVLVVCSRRLLIPLEAVFPSPRYYFDPESVAEVSRNGGMFNILDMQTGEKIDFWALSDSRFDESRFDRKVQSELFGRKAWVSAPEDTILAKLRWAKKAGGSSKQILDAQNVYLVNDGTLDMEYLEAWVRHLGVQKEWGEIIGNE